MRATRRRHLAATAAVVGVARLLRAGDVGVPRWHGAAAAAGSRWSRCSSSPAPCCSWGDRCAAGTPVTATGPSTRCVRPGPWCWPRPARSPGRRWPAGTPRRPCSSPVTSRSSRAASGSCSAALATLAAPRHGRRRSRGGALVPAAGRRRGRRRRRRGTPGRRCALTLPDPSGRGLPAVPRRLVRPARPPPRGRRRARCGAARRRRRRGSAPRRSRSSSSTGSHPASCCTISARPRRSESPSSTVSSKRCSRCADRAVAVQRAGARPTRAGRRRRRATTAYGCGAPSTAARAVAVGSSSSTVGGCSRSSDSIGVTASRRRPRSDPTKSATKSFAGAPSTVAGSANCSSRPPWLNTAIRSAEPHRLVDVVGDEQHRLVQLVLDPAELRLQPVPGDRVDRAERLVHQQHRRVGGERPGHADPLPLTAGQLVRVAACRSRRRVEPDEVEQLRRRGRACGERSQPSRSGTVATLPRDRQVREQPDLLDHVADPAAQLHRRRRG